MITLTMESVSLKNKFKKQKMIPDCQCRFSLDQNAVHHKEKRSKSKANKSEKSCHIKSSGKKEYKVITDQEKDGDKQIQLEVWYYLLHNLDESEKLIALKLLIGINKMKKNWRDNFTQNKYVDKKVVEDMKLIIKNLQDEQKKYKAEKQKLIQEKNQLEQKLIEEKKCRMHLAGMLVNAINKYEKEASNEVKVFNKTQVLKIAEDEPQNQTFTGVISKQKSSTSKILLNDSNNNNTQVSKIKDDTQKEGYLRNALNVRENEGNKGHHMNFVQPPTRHFSSPTPRSRRRRSPGNINDRLCVNIRTTIKRIPELIRIMEQTLKSPISISKAVPINEGWKIEFPSFREKINFFNQRRMFFRTELYITNPYRQ